MKYTDSHEWIQVENGVGTVGVTRFAAQELGEITSVGLPEVGVVLKAGEEGAVLESCKAAADIYSPVSGTILATNPNASSHINQAPEGEGWLFKIAVSHPSEVDALLSEEQYVSLVSPR